MRTGQLQSRGLVRRDAPGSQICDVSAHQVLEESVQFFLGQRTNVIPFVMVAYYDEIGVRRSSCTDDDVGFGRLILIALW